MTQISLVIKANTKDQAIDAAIKRRVVPVRYTESVGNWIILVTSPDNLEKVVAWYFETNYIPFPVGTLMLYTIQEKS